MDLFEMRDFDAHEQVTFGYDAPSGLRAIIAIHSTALGPAAGGCRMWPYAALADAAADALRLSRGMSYKNAMADLPFGGGKAVIVGDPRQKTSSADGSIRPARRFPRRPLHHRRGRGNDDCRHGAGGPRRRGS